MRRWTRWAASLAVLTGSVVGGLAVHSASAGGAEPPPQKAEQHCVVHVLDRAPDGELRTSEPACFPTLAKALGSAGLAGATWTIGIHFDGPAYTGDSFSVVGADCTGGWLNLSAAWRNRVSSTMNGCPHIRHYDGNNLTPPYETTSYPGGNLLSLNNQTNSIQYLP